MHPQPGQMLSRYRLIEPIGKGGMGVVWKAWDAQLRREVALKLLPADMVQTAERRQRFLREARAAAAISHPNIATVFEVGESDGHAFIAMELVKGRTLREQMRGKPLPVSEILSIACQLADGLTHAHQASVIHRDLKPDNIMIGADGHVRVLDFGLAKLLEAGDESPTAVSQMSTISEEMTLAGKVIGTAAYMSPEQARGAAVDPRSDTFSFGATLYEMATGLQPFRGATPVDTMTAVLQHEPTLASSLNAEIPFELERIIRKCLQKDPSDRYQDSRDLLVDLRQLKRDSDSQPLQRSPSGADSAPTFSLGKSVRRVLGTLLVVAILTVCGIILLRQLHSPGGSYPDIQQRLLTTNTIDDPVWTALISPDGKYLAYWARSGTYLQVVSTGEDKRISPLRGVEEVFPSGWFPDSLHLAVSLEPDDASPSLWSYSIVTGALQKIRDGASGPAMCAAVSPDGRSLAFVPDDGKEEIWLMDADGSNPRRVVAKEENDRYVNLWVRWSPDSKRILYRRYTRFPDGFKNSIETCDLQGRARTQVVEPIMHVFPGIHAEWVPDGRVIFSRTEPDGRLRDNNLWEVSMDVATGKPLGRPRRLTSWVGYFSYYLSSTRDGELAVVRWRTQQETFVASVDKSGQRLLRSRSVMSDAMDDAPVAWMDDGNSLLIASDRRGNYDIYSLDVNTGSFEPLVASAAEEVPATISPDGKWILYTVHSEHLAVAVDTPSILMRVPVSGGAPETIMEVARVNSIQCSKVDGGRCILATSKSDEILLVEELDPFSGRGPVLGEFHSSLYTLALSPDGQRLAWLEVSDGAVGSLKVVNLMDGDQTELILGEWTMKGSPAWTPSSDGLFVFAKAGERRAVLRVSLDGDVLPLSVAEDEEDLTGHLLPSPDGNCFAFARSLRESSVWLLSNL